MSRTASAVGHVRIEFELDCEGPCLFEMFAVSCFREMLSPGTLGASFLILRKQLPCIQY